MSHPCMEPVYTGDGELEACARSVIAGTDLCERHIDPDWLRQILNPEGQLTLSDEPGIVLTYPAGETEMSNKNGSSWIRREKRLAIYLRDGFICVYCRRDLRDAAKSEVSLDHLIPRSEGGDNHQTNLVTACTPCNSSRQDRSLLDWALSQSFTMAQVSRIQEAIGKAITTALNIELAKAILSGETPEIEVNDPDAVPDLDEDAASLMAD